MPVEKQTNGETGIIVESALTSDKTVADPLYGNDFYPRIIFKIVPDLGNVYIQIAAVKERIATP